jgi:hypothetical protein
VKPASRPRIPDAIYYYKSSSPKPWSAEDYADILDGGPVELAGISIVNNQLDTVSLTAERDFVFPASTPIVSGTVSGSATYHVQTGALDGGLSGSASVDCNLASRESMAAARSAHERWLTPLVPTTVASGWNEHGDRRVAPLAPVARPPFTLYDTSNRVGYKALVVHPGGVIDEIAWSQLRTIAAARALRDGTPVAAVRIVFPRRDDALRFHARAIAEGFEMAMYPDRGAFWEVHPAIDHPSTPR